MFDPLPDDDHDNEVYQTVLTLAEQFRAEIPSGYQTKAVNLLLYELTHDDPEIENVAKQ